MLHVIFLFLAWACVEWNIHGILWIVLETDICVVFFVIIYNIYDEFVPQVSDSDKTKMEEAIDEKIKWLEENQDTDTEDYKTQKKELEDIVQPIIAKLYQGAGGAPPPSNTDDDDDLKDELWDLDWKPIMM